MNGMSKFFAAAVVTCASFVSFAADTEPSGVELVDLTSPEIACSYEGTAPNAFVPFNNNTALNDSTLRVLVKDTKTTVICDFGEGNERAVNAYKIYAYYKGYNDRGPRDWTLYGSNDNSTWVELDSRDGEINWQNYESRYFQFPNRTPFRYYKLAFTATSGATNYIQFGMLEYFSIPQFCVENAAMSAPANGSVTVTGTAVGGSGSVKAVFSTADDADVEITLGNFGANDAVNVAIDAETAGLSFSKFYTAKLVGTSGAYTFTTPIAGTFYFGSTLSAAECAKKIELEISSDIQTALGNEVLSNVPVLVRLSTDIEGFRYSDFQMSNGADLLFTDESGHLLDFEIDTWNTNGESLVWIKIPALSATTRFYAYYGASIPAVHSAVATWSDYIGVWHLAEHDSNGITADASGHGFDGDSGDFTEIDGPVGGAAEGVKGIQVADYEPGYIVGDHFSISGWFKVPCQTNQYTKFVTKKTGLDSGSSLGWYIELSKSPTTINFRPGNKSAGYSGFPKANQNWNYFYLVSNGFKTCIYLNGDMTPVVDVSATLLPSEVPLTIIGEGQQGDEFRLAKTNPSALRTSIEYKTMAIPGFLEYGDVEDVESSVTQNYWTVDPSITKTMWIEGQESGVLTPGEFRFGEPTVTISKDGGSAESFDGTLPTEPGEYVITYDMSNVTGYDLDHDVTKSVEFTILSDDVVPPFSVSVTTDPTFSVDSENSEVDLSIAYAVSSEFVNPGKTVDVRAIYWCGEDAAVTNDVLIAEDVALDASGNGAISNVTINADCHVCLYGVGGDTHSATTQVYTVSIPGPFVIDANATFTNDPKEFVISGTAVPGLGETVVTVYWSVNSDAMDNSATFTFDFGDEGGFSTNIVYAGLNDTLTWKVDIGNTFGDNNWSTGGTMHTKSRVDSSAVTYTWTALGGDNIWTNCANWTADSPESYGYPDNASFASARFASDAVVDLDGGTYHLATSGLVLDGGVGDNGVKIMNGTLNWNRVDHDIGYANKTLVFENMVIGGGNNFGLNTYATVEMVGTNTVNAYYRQYMAADMTLIVRDGSTSFDRIPTQKIQGGTRTISTIIITNAVLSTTDDYTFNVTKTELFFKKGGEIQPRLSLTKDFYTTYTSSFNFDIPARGVGKEYITTEAVHDNCGDVIINVDVTDYSSGGAIPLIKFTSNIDQSEFADKVTLKAFANDVDVTSKRHAHAVFKYNYDEQTGEVLDNTLYFKQKSGFVLVVY